MQNGEIYVGEWSEGEKNGRGQYEFATGDLYEGYWVNGKRHGKGVYRWKNGETYNGDWRNDRMNGFGVTKLKEIWKEGRGTIGKTTLISTFEKIVIFLFLNFIHFFVKSFEKVDGNVYEGEFRDDVAVQ